MDERWLVADMDDTLVPKPRTGLFPPATESPAWEPLLAWLRAGGRLLVVTTANRRAFVQLWDCLPPQLLANGRVVFCTLEGGCLTVGDADGSPVEDLGYRAAAAGGLGTCMAAQHLGEILERARAMLLAFFTDLRADRTPLLALSDKYQGPFGAIVDGDQPLEEALEMGRLREQGAIMEATNERILSLNLPGTVKPGTPEAEAAVCSIVVMGLPDSCSERYLAPHLEAFAAMGVAASSAPNSVWLKRADVDKSLPMRWMAARPEEFGFRLRNAIAFGDNPTGNDAPLTSFVGEGMPFVSVAPSDAGLVAALLPTHVGGCCDGTAAVVAKLVGLENWPPDGERLGGLVADAAAELRAAAAM